MKKIFFSYSRKDESFVMKLAKDLQAAGEDIWVDQLHIRKGEPWDEEIEKALESCNAVIVVLSPASVISDNVLNEINFALEEKKQVLPLLTDNSIRKPFNIRRLQHIDFTGLYENGLSGLLKALHEEMPTEKVAAVAPGIDGKWSSEELVNPFDKNDLFKLSFEFETMGSMLMGTITKTAVDKGYTVRKGFLDGKIKDGIISFYTMEQSLLGNETISYKDFYYGTNVNEGVKFMQQSDRPWGFPTQKFVVKREEEA